MLTQSMETEQNFVTRIGKELLIGTFDRITTYPYGSNAFKVSKSEMLIVKDLFFEIVLQQQ